MTRSTPSIPIRARSFGKFAARFRRNHQRRSRNCGQVTPEIGITSTPVIDRKAGANGIIYAVAMSKKGSTYFQRLHALDITTGAELEWRPNNSSSVLSRDRRKQFRRKRGLRSEAIQGACRASSIERSHLYQLGVALRHQPYTAWIMGYNQANLAQTSILNLTPNGSEGSIWQSGGGFAADPQGNIYALIANGTFDTTLDTNGFPNKQRLRQRAS